MSGPAIRLRAAAMLLAAGAQGCGRQGPDEAAALPLAMPPEYEVSPDHYDDRSCACEIDRMCAMLSDAVPGHFETRKISCRPLDVGQRTVRCEAETRFITTHYLPTKKADGQYETRDVPGDWRPHSVILKEYGPGQWCRL
jgi:hypothetical protein